MSSSNLGEPSPSKSPSKSPMMSSPVAESIGAVASASASDRAAASALGALAALSPRRLHTPPAPPSPVSACRLSESSARSGASDATDATDATLPTISAMRALAPSPPATVNWQAVLSEQPPWEVAMYMLLHARARCWREVAELHTATQRANETRATRGAPAAPPPPPMMGALPKGWFPDAELGLGATRPEMSAEASGLINEVLAVLRQPARLRDACPALGVWRPADVPTEASSVFSMMQKQLSTGKHRIRKDTGAMVDSKKSGTLRWLYFQPQVEALLAEPLLMLAAYSAMRAPATEPAPRPGRPPAAPPTPGEALLRCATAAAEEQREGMAVGKLQNATLTARVEELEQRESENALSAAQLAGCSSCFHSVLETMALEADDEFTAVIHRQGEQTAAQVRTWQTAARVRQVSARALERTLDALPHVRRQLTDEVMQGRTRTPAARVSQKVRGGLVQLLNCGHLRHLRGRGSQVAGALQLAVGVTCH
jgi:chemotaxis protein histidine kinase CheA